MYKQYAALCMFRRFVCASIACDLVACFYSCFCTCDVFMCNDQTPQISGAQHTHASLEEAKGFAHARTGRRFAHARTVGLHMRIATKFMAQAIENKEVHTVADREQKAAHGSGSPSNSSSCCYDGCCCNDRCCCNDDAAATTDAGTAGVAATTDAGTPAESRVVAGCSAAGDLRKAHASRLQKG